MILSSTNPRSYVQLRDAILSQHLRSITNLYMPGKDGDAKEDKTLTQKEHRRAQVRKAQIEHRQRKENYVKHLEQDIIGLREMITAVEIEATGIKKENTAIKTTLSNSNIANTVPTSTSVQLSQEDFSPPNFAAFQQSPPQDPSLPDFPTFQSPQQDIPPANFNNYQSPQYSSNSHSNASLSTVSISFDDVIDASCLHVSASGDFNNTTVLNSPDIFNFPTNSLPEIPFAATSGFPDANQGLQKPLPQLPNQDAAISLPSPLDISAIAINFILALEHPCRTHFHAHPAEFDPTGAPSGHELMASTLLYAHAPEPVFTALHSDQPSTSTTTPDISWSVPSLELTQLWEMSRSLPKGDFEITPVQAWFLLTANYDMGKLLRKLGELKQGIGKLVACWEFGALMDEAEFWDVVRGILGPEDLVT